jgi:tetratricopeptide (TPR) repeat protein
MYLGDYDTARDLMDESLAILRSVHGELHPSIAVGVRARSMLYQLSGDLKAAARGHEEAIDISRRLFGEDTSGYADTMHSAGTFYSSIQDWEKTEACLDVVLPIYRQVHGNDHQQTISVIGLLSEVYSETGRTEESLVLAKEHYEGSRAASGATSRMAAIAAAEYADALLEAYRDEAAAAMFENSVKLFEGHNDAMGLAYTRAKWARALLRTGEIDQAEAPIAEAMAWVRSDLDKPPTVVGRVLVAAGEMANAKGQETQAAALAEEALDILSAGPKNTWYRLAQLVMAEAELASGNIEAAGDIAAEVADGLKRDDGIQTRAEAMARQLLARVDQAIAGSI